VRRLEWKQHARHDLLSIVRYIAQDNPTAAAMLADEIEAKAGGLIDHPTLYRAGRIKGTREMVVRPGYVVVYRVTATAVCILRVLHTARQYP